MGLEGSLLLRLCVESESSSARLMWSMFGIGGKSEEKRGEEREEKEKASENRKAIYSSAAGEQLQWIDGGAVMMRGGRRACPSELGGSYVIKRVRAGTCATWLLHTQLRVLRGTF